MTDAIALTTGGLLTSDPASITTSGDVFFLTVTLPPAPVQEPLVRRVNLSSPFTYLHHKLLVVRVFYAGEVFTYRFSPRKISAKVVEVEVTPEDRVPKVRILDPEMTVQ